MICSVVPIYFKTVLYIFLVTESTILWNPYEQKWKSI